MKKIILLLTPLLLLASNNTQDRIKALEDELKTIKTDMKYHQDDLDERMPIIESVEKKSILDKINFSPEVLIRFDKMDYKTSKIEGENTIIQAPHPMQGEQRRDEYSKEFDLAAAVRVRLNMEADLGESIEFHGRMVFMNSSQSHQRLCILSRDVKSAESSSAFDIDRAYIDYTPNKISPYPFTFSFGLLPTTGGTPMQYAQDTSRKSMFPALVFDMNSYGLIGTQKLGESTYIRAILAKAYTMRANFYPYQCNRENIDNANIMGIYADTKFNFLGKSLLSFGVNMLHDLRAHPYLGPDVTSSDSQILGNMLTFGLGLDIDKLAGSDTTLFIHTALSNPHGNTKIDDYQIELVGGVQDPNDPGFTVAEYATGEMLNSNGYSIYLGTKYEATSTISIGAEYNYGSKYWFSATQGAEDMYNKLATRGQVIEAYGIWKFHKNLSTKLGFMQSDEMYTGSGWHFGEPVKKDATQNISYLTFEAKF
ncbi:MAG: hypothetical protein DRG78_22345 [Epsilonproteobacteria bacterium]|nr:MAG: hypothetical protein DRG78_22345 [Campylobacterota bacterium]